MTPKTSNSNSVTTAEISSEGRQPMLFEKKTNIRWGYPRLR